MKYIRFLIIGIVAFAIVVTVFSLMIPSHVRISRATNLAPGADSVLLQIADLGKWKNWYPQFENIDLKDEELAGSYIVKATANGIRLSVNFFSDTLVTIEMLKGRRPVMNNWKLIRHGTADSLTIQNYIDFDFEWYPWEKFSSLLLDASYGPVMEQGLQNLKSGL